MIGSFELQGTPGFINTVGAFDVMQAKRILQMLCKTAHSWVIKEYGI